MFEFENFQKMSRKRTKKSSLISILLVAAAIALWVADAYRDVDPVGPRDKREQGSSPAARKTNLTGKYETFPGCTLAGNRSDDGDSFRVRLPGGRTEIIRLYFVDCPESAFKSYGGGRNNHARIGDQAAALGRITTQQAVEIGREAKEFAIRHLGKEPFTLHTEWDSPFNDERYHGFVELSYKGRDRFLHELLVEKGYARIHTKGAPLPDGTSEREQEARLHDLQRSAKSSNAGAWGL